MKRYPGSWTAAAGPALHGFSPSVVPRPQDWPAGYEATGYWWPQRPDSWSPPAELEEFLNSGPPPVFFGFGDMTPENTSDFIELAAAAGRQAGVRQVIQAQLTDPTPAGRHPPGHSIVVGDLPHDWLFPKMAAVVHHAGAGTTAAGLRAGAPAVTVPVLADQSFWAARPAALSVGPPPIPYRRLTIAAPAAGVLLRSRRSSATRTRPALPQRRTTRPRDAAFSAAHVETRQATDQYPARRFALHQHGYPRGPPSRRTRPQPLVAALPLKAAMQCGR